jgi:hypothetical protein
MSDANASAVEFVTVELPDGRTIQVPGKVVGASKKKGYLQMKVHHVPTMKVVLQDGRPAIINESDFNPELHRRPEDIPVRKPVVMPHPFEDDDGVGDEDEDDVTPEPVAPEDPEPDSEPDDDEGEDDEIEVAPTDVSKVSAVDAIEMVKALDTVEALDAAKANEHSDGSPRKTVLAAIDKRMAEIGAE